MTRKTAESCTDTLGIICVTIIGFQLTRFLYRVIYKNIIAPGFGINSANLKEMGRWAVVTGATDGVGKAYAEALAKKGMSIVLISRTQAKLESISEEIARKYEVETKIIAVDFTEGESIYHTIDKQLQGMEIGVLINNVGMSYPHPEYFLEPSQDNRLYQNIINCNILSVTNMCKIVMPGMVERKKGVVVNIASTAALIPSPLLTIYAASKAYVDKFSVDLAKEYSKQGIIVQCLLPGYVATKMSKIRTSTWMAPSPDAYVKQAMKTIGVSDRTPGYFAHTLMVGFISTLDYFSPQLSKWLVMGTMENIRRRALRKQPTN